MTKHYGTFVGTPKQSSPPTPVDMGYERSFDETIVRDVYTNAGATAFTDTISAAIVGWDTLLDYDDCRAHWTAGGAGCTLSFGSAGFPNALDNAVDIHLAGAASLGSAITVPNYWRPVWQDLGYATLAAAKLVANQCELIFTINTANFAAGSLTWRLKGSRRL
jgi:hypothetical protein